MGMKKATHKVLKFGEHKEVDEALCNGDFELALVNTSFT